ncbi:MAG TPA: hypothetical protein DCZ94_13705 [Lentisphaeria bacterium]|nr:MAG: hypothetical protein A2X48_11280 [Lentisphaerae bacterium GWF2_49_21]HBC88001.1 hypothetical protein [Lentisphaeria bacterium]
MKQQVEKTYDAQSNAYDKAHSSCTASEITAVEEIVVKSLLRRIEFKDVLDAGTGTGRYAVFLAKQGKRVEATDQSSKMLEVARGKSEELGLSIAFRKEDVSNISAKDESFDLVMCMLTLAHVEDLNQPFKEFVRVLRPGGHIIISDIHPDIQKTWGPGLMIDIEGSQFPFPAFHGSVEEYVNAAEKAGAEIIAAIDVPMQQKRGLYPGPFVMLARKG